jgi:cytochrome oxidase assembly protein ShyY1
VRYRLLRPRWLGIHLAAILIIVGCAVGASWQFDAARTPDLDAVPTAEDITDPRELSEILGPGEYLPPAQANQGVQATGTFDPEHRVLVPGPSASGESGFYVVDALVLDSDTAVAVNSGWLEAEAAETGGTPTPPEGEVTVTGWLTPPQSEPHEGHAAVGLPEDRAERITPSILVNRWPYALYEGYITSAQGIGAGLEAAPPEETPEKYDWNWRSLSYSAQWALFAGVAGIFWISLIRRELAAPADEEAATT